MNNINVIGEKCNGCQGCVSVCPCDAIKPKRGPRGELLYNANEKCINCGKCLKVCTVINVNLNTESPFFYKAISKDAKVLEMSSSGGIAYELARQCINNDSIVYGAAWDINEQKVRHKRIDTLEQLSELQGSKYVQSIIDKSIFDEIKSSVKEKKIVFFGCPCQVSAVKNLVGENDNLVCVDLVCHGVPSMEMLNSQLERIANSKIENISFRQGLSFILDVFDENGNSCSVNGYDIPYYALFLTYTSLRESCYQCPYAQRKRVGDITLGDYVEDGKGYSCVIINTYKGEHILQSIGDRISQEKRNSDLLDKNDALNHPTIRNDKVDKFLSRYSKRGLYYAYYRTFPIFVIKRLVRHILGDKLYDSIKRLKQSLLSDC